MNRRRRQVVEREENIIQLLIEFDTLDQNNSEVIAEMAFRLGSIGKYDMELFETPEFD